MWNYMSMLCCIIGVFCISVFLPHRKKWRAIIAAAATAEGQHFRRLRGKRLKCLNFYLGFMETFSTWKQDVGLLSELSFYQTSLIFWLNRIVFHTKEQKTSTNWRNSFKTHEFASDRGVLNTASAALMDLPLCQFETCRSEEDNKSLSHREQRQHLEIKATMWVWPAT